MRSGISPINSAVASRNTLALAIAAVAQSDGDYTTAIPALSLHRRNMPTAPMHCIYGLGLGVVAQGGKQVMFGGEVIDYGPGQSMLTTVDLPVVAHVTRASVREEAALCRGGASGKVGCSRTHEPVHLSPAFPRHYWRESVAIPETVAPPGGTATDAQRGSRREQRQRAGRL